MYQINTKKITEYFQRKLNQDAPCVIQKFNLPSGKDKSANSKEERYIPDNKDHLTPWIPRINISINNQGTSNVIGNDNIINKKSNQRNNLFNTDSKNSNRINYFFNINIK